MNDSAPAYGLWLLVILNSAVFIIFAFSFFKPRTKRDWRSFSAFSAFIVALFVEMYGFPLTIFLLSGWLQTRAPGVDLMSHEAGHLWSTVFGLKGDPHFGALHILSSVFLVGGFWLLASAWPMLYRAQKARRLATEGVYARVRHPQYVGFVLIMFGFLLQWPTILTLAMFPVLVFMYARLAISEEHQSEQEFGQAWLDYAAHTPRFFPRLTGSRQPMTHGRA
jgi:protein-S-isoprenylcysteine O-methyltransferase Ste14